MESREVRSPKRFGEDVGGIVSRFDTGDGDFTIRYLVAYIMIFDVDVFHLRVPHVVFCEEGHGIVVAV